MFFLSFQSSNLLSRQLNISIIPLWSTLNSSNLDPDNDLENPRIGLSDEQEQIQIMTQTIWDLVSVMIQIMIQIIHASVPVMNSNKSISVSEINKRINYSSVGIIPGSVVS